MDRFSDATLLPLLEQAVTRAAKTNMAANPNEVNFFIYTPISKVTYYSEHRGNTLVKLSDICC